MFFNKDESPFVRWFSGGSAPKIKAPEKPAKQEEVRRIDQSAEDERGRERKRIPPGRKSTLFSGIEKMLKAKLGK
jgi:hypothetical protein